MWDSSDEQKLAIAHDLDVTYQTLHESRHVRPLIKRLLTEQGLTRHPTPLNLSIHSPGAAMHIRESWSGRYYEDFEVGDVYRHPLGRTINEADNTFFTLLTMNTNQMHFNSHYAEQSEFGRLLVNSGLTVAIVLGQSVTDISQNAVANLGWSQIRLPHPVFVGDTLYAESLVQDKRESRSRPHAGIVTVRTRGINQDGEICITYNRTVLVYRRGALTDRKQKLFPEPLTPIEESD